MAKGFAILADVLGKAASEVSGNIAEAQMKIPAVEAAQKELRWKEEEAARKQALFPWELKGKEAEVGLSEARTAGERARTAGQETQNIVSRDTIQADIDRKRAEADETKQKVEKMRLEVLAYNKPAYHFNENMARMGFYLKVTPNLENPADPLEEKVPITLGPAYKEAMARLAANFPEKMREEFLTLLEANPVAAQEQLKGFLDVSKGSIQMEERRDALANTYFPNKGGYDKLGIQEKLIVDRATAAYQASVADAAVPPLERQKAQAEIRYKDALAGKAQRSPEDLDRELKQQRVHGYYVNGLRASIAAIDNRIRALNPKGWDVSILMQVLPENSPIFKELKVLAEERTAKMAELNKAVSAMQPPQGGAPTPTPTAAPVRKFIRDPKTGKLIPAQE